MSHEIQGVLFDLDGTLIDTHDLILSSFRHATREVLGRELPDEVLLQKVGQPLVVQMWDFTDDDATHELLVRTYREHNHSIHDAMVRMFPQVGEVLEALLAEGYPMGVVTSKRHALAQRALDVLGIAPSFKFLVGPDDYPAHKPDPGPVEHGCDLLGLRPDECLYVGDSPFDMQAGNGAGCVTVAATWGMFPPEVLAAENPDFTLASISELPALLARL
ncbi:MULTISPECIES: HAD family hydrolase [unclassified Adlercreutzia]|uniref:HAD family hydrolase n=1 Tax=unclassified Adlercreutzia TaxID=2636013 RepID=UPI0013EDC87D|nr:MULTISPECIES: HAD-IA family hydrolase [unclassified Adlercreutzia]